jgi:riboflavin-specific deaminase-like protein
MSERPFVLWKCAASLDGRIAAADGASKWITSGEARADGHRLRAECGAVMVGSGTQQADDPQLAVRDAEVTRQPLRIVVDSVARTPVSARVLDDAAPTLIAVADDADASHLEGRADIVRLPRVDAGLDLDLLLKALSEREVRAVLVEGGPTLAGSSLAAGSSGSTSACTTGTPPRPLHSTLTSSASMCPEAAGRFTQMHYRPPDGRGSRRALPLSTLTAVLPSDQSMESHRRTVNPPTVRLLSLGFSSRRGEGVPLCTQGAL